MHRVQCPHPVHSRWHLHWFGAPAQSSPMINEYSFLQAQLVHVTTWQEILKMICEGLLQSLRAVLNWHVPYSALQSCMMYSISVRLERAVTWAPRTMPCNFRRRDLFYRLPPTTGASSHVQHRVRTAVDYPNTEQEAESIGRKTETCLKEHWHKIRIVWKVVWWTNTPTKISRWVIVDAPCGPGRGNSLPKRLPRAHFWHRGSQQIEQPVKARGWAPGK